MHRIFYLVLFLFSLVVLESTVEYESSKNPILDFFLLSMPIIYGLLAVATIIALVVLINFIRSNMKGDENEETKTSTALSVIKFILYLVLIPVIGIFALYFGIYLLIF